MHKKVVLGTFVLMLLANIPSVATATNTTILYIDRSMTIVPGMGDSFAVNVTVFNVTDLAGWEFKLYYESSMLNATSITEGPFLKTGGSTGFMVINFTDNYNATHGLIWATCVILGHGLGVSGSGTLGTISFKAKLSGVSILHLTDTSLCNSEPDPKPIPHATIDGTVKVLIHSIAIVSVTPFKTVVGQGLALSINVIIANQGESAETFNVTAYTDITIIQTKTIILTSGNSTTVTFTWNTTGIAKGNYAISAYATPVPGETDTADNTYDDGWVVVTIPGDINADGAVDSTDDGMFGVAWASIRGQPYYNPNCDFNNDDVIDSTDDGIFGVHWGQVA